MASIPIENAISAVGWARQHAKEVSGGLGAFSRALAGQAGNAEEAAQLLAEGLQYGAAPETHFRNSPLLHREVRSSTYSTWKR